jgi:hypothetical protein
VVLPDEDVAAFAALEAALLAELAPVGALQRVLAGQIVSAAWRLARVDRMEAEVLIFRQRRDADLGLAVIRDGNSSRTVPTLLRYRGAAQAEFLRSLRTLQALQAAAAKPARVAGPAAVLTFEPGPGRAAAAQGAPGARARHREPRREPNEPEPRGDLGSAPAAQAAQIDATAGVTRARPNEPERPAAASLLQQSAAEPTGPEALAESARVRMGPARRLAQARGRSDRLLGSGPRAPHGPARAGRPALEIGSRRRPG